MFVLRVVGGADEVAAKGFHLADNHGGIGFRVSAAFALWDFLVEVDTFEEHRLAVKENVRALYLDRAESDFVINAVFACGNCHVVDFG